MAQPGRALRSGRRGRGFKSHPSDHFKSNARLGVFFEIGCVGFEATKKWVRPQEKGEWKDAGFMK